MRWWLVVAGLALGRGAVAQEIPRAGQELPRTDWGTFNFERSTGTTTGTLTATADEVFTALPATFAELGLEPKLADPAERTLALKRFRLIRKLGKHPISKFLSCGDGLVGPNADSYYVYLTMTVRVSAAGAKESRLDMFFGAEAVNVPGGQSDRLPCATTGVFEHQLVTKLRAKFAAPA